MKLLGTLTGEGFESKVFLEQDGQSERVFFVGDFDIDVDGSGGNPDGDQFFLPDTTLHKDGRAINPYVVPGVVVPPLVVKATRGVVMGCRARVTNLRNMKSCEAVVHDLGPTRKTGEGTPFLAARLGINTNPNNGGEDFPVVLYEIFPGQPATVEGVTYDLQPS